MQRNITVTAAYMADNNNIYSFTKNLKLRYSYQCFLNDKNLRKR